MISILKHNWIPKIQLVTNPTDIPQILLVTQQIVITGYTIFNGCKLNPQVLMAKFPSFCDIFPSAPRYTWIEHQIGWHRVRQNDAPVRGIQTGTGCLPKCGGVVELAIFGFKMWSLTSQFKEDGISSNKQTVTINNNLVLNH